MYSECIMNSASDGAAGALTRRDISSRFSTDVPCGNNGGRRSLNALIHPVREWEGFPFDGPYECKDNFL